MKFHMKFLKQRNNYYSYGSHLLLLITSIAHIKSVNKNINQLMNALIILFFKTLFSICNFIYRIFIKYFAMYNIIVGTINQLPRQLVVGVIEKYKEYYALLRK